MKTRLFASMALTAAILFTSCSKELDQNNVITEIRNSPIAFGTYSGVTKGTAMNNTTFPVVGNKFKVTGFLTDGGAQYMSAVIINKTTGVGKDGVWVKTLLHFLKTQLRSNLLRIQLC